MQVPSSEDLASRTVPESCGAYREVCREALTGVSIGQPLSCETSNQGADAINAAEGNTRESVHASSLPALRGPRPWHVDKLLVDGNREISSLARGAISTTGPRREGEEPKPMMYGMEKSDPFVVAKKSANRPETGKRQSMLKSDAESMEPREGAKGNTVLLNKRRTQSRISVSQRIGRVRKVARERKQEKFTSLLHHLDEAMLLTAYHGLKRNAAPGVDRVTWQEYGENLESNLTDLHRRVQSGTYRAQPSRRRYIPKADGRSRPLGIASLEDKLVQRGVVEVLNAIYEEDFKGFSYGFRPKRSQHDALDALATGITRTKVNWILDADISRFFDTVDHSWLIRFVEHRIGDARVIRLIKQWLEAGYLEEGVVKASEEGTPQGSVISPLLANIYLHYVFDLWAHQWRKGNARGAVMMIRYADDLVCGFGHKEDAERFLADLRARLEKFGLSLHPEKTRLVEFGRFAVRDRKRRGLGKPETFDFLGFTHMASHTRQGYFQLKRKSRRDRMQAKLRELKEELRRRMHQPIPEQGQWLSRVVTGYFAYHAVPTNITSLGSFRSVVVSLWRRTLRYRSQKDRTTWERIRKIAQDWLPRPSILHPWPEARFAANYPRWKPGA